MNHAGFNNIVFERGALESVPDFRARVRAIVAELGGGVLAWGAPEGLEWIEAEPDIIMIGGGLKDDASGDFAQLGDATVERETGESIEDFQRRARELAIAAGSPRLCSAACRR
jgi:hypothetical protein